VHGSAGFFFSNPKGGWEFLAFWILALLTQALLGDGAYALRAGSIKAASTFSVRSA
jgi:putative oxidoreductase